jgi:hypothetical protein
MTSLQPSALQMIAQFLLLCRAASIDLLLLGDSLAISTILFPLGTFLCSRSGKFKRPIKF